MFPLLFFIPFLLMSILFFSHMKKEPRGMQTGVLFLIYLMITGGTALFLLIYYSGFLQKYFILYSLLLILGVLIVISIILFPFVLIIVYFVQGLLILKKEGLRLTNVLSLAFSVALTAYIFVWPLFRFNGSINLYNKPLLLIADLIYQVLGFIFIYLLFLMAMYCLSALLNLIHIKKNQNLDYIIVLGAGIKGTRVTPLLASRINKGIELLQRNPQAKLILSGGQGPGEDIPEGVAMAAYTREKGVSDEQIIIEDQSKNTRENLLFSSQLMEKKNPKIALVTTSYHVFRALVFAKKLHIPCIGYGSKTKWYFTLNALIREYIGYLSISYRFHMIIILVYTIALSIFTIITYLNKINAFHLLKNLFHP